MWERPTKYQMKIQFMDALPEGFEHVLTIVNGLSVEYNSLAQLYSAALDMEQNTLRSVSQLPRTGNASLARPSGSHPYQSRLSTVPKPPPRPAVQTTPGYVPKRSGDNRTGDNPSSKSTAKCFSCGRVGHFASDPTCPNAGRKPGGGQRMFAQCVVNDMSDGKQEHERDNVGENTAPLTNPLEDQKDETAGEDTPVRTDIVQFGGMEITGDYPESEYELEGSQYESDNEKYYDSTDEDVGYVSVFMGGMRIEPLPAEPSTSLIWSHSMEVGNNRADRHSWLYDARVRRITDPAAQPMRTEESQRTLCAEIPINGSKALVLFDSGCTTDSVTPEFAYICKAGRIDLKEPVGLQLGTKGSRTRINFGVQASIELGPVHELHYFDVVDIDKYDAILGTVFCHQHNVVLDFGKNRITVRGHNVPTYKHTKEANNPCRVPATRHADRPMHP
ncbi:hypothetical protein PYCCODRAFT_1372543 [Trametes coccinea BRFM310]|uniref:CCHC-type domain-containing protein n=1 Tax=Trametes coccinea (strain BRFM310) TaxID=1353009 RepID=A0A1Y2IF46_TRAC3|nr:hypothetical protein PYCCODRAFT_1372543 [Trametes coccinea BRFM310]